VPQRVPLAGIKEADRLCSAIIRLMTLDPLSTDDEAQTAKGNTVSASMTSGAFVLCGEKQTLTTSRLWTVIRERDTYG